MLLFLTFYSSKNPEKSITVSTKLLRSTTFFSIANKKKLEQISILEWFLNDHVTLKTGVRAAENNESNNKLTTF